MNENNPYAFNYLSLINLRERNLAKTIQYAKKAIKLKPNFPEPYSNLSNAYFKSDDLDKSIQILLDCFNNCPIVPINHYLSLVQIVSKNEHTILDEKTDSRYGLGPWIVIKDDFTRKMIINSLKNQPKHYLVLAEQYLNRFGSTEVQKLLEEFTCPEELKNLNASSRNSARNGIIYF